MQEDKESVFDACDTAKMCVEVMSGMISTMKALPENMKKAAQGGFINATDMADYLVGKGLPFRDAYKITGTLVAQCIEKGLTLETLPVDEYRKMSELFGEDVYEAISLDTCVRERKSEGGPSPEAVKAQIAQAEKALETE